MTAKLPSTTALKIPTQPSISVGLEASEALTTSRPALAVAVTGVDTGTTYTIPLLVKVLKAGVVVVMMVSVVVPTGKSSDVVLLS